MRPTRNQAIEDYRTPRVKEKWGGIWDYKGKKDNSATRSPYYAVVTYGDSSLAGGSCLSKLL